MLLLVVFNLCRMIVCNRVLQIRRTIMISDDIGDSYKEHIEFCLLLFICLAHLFIKKPENYRASFLETLAFFIFRIIWNIWTHYVVLVSHHKTTYRLCRAVRRGIFSWRIAFRLSQRTRQGSYSKVWNSRCRR